MLQRLARHRDAAGALRRALAADGQYLPARVKLAEALFDSGELQESRPLFESLTSVTAAEPAALVGLGRIAAIEGRHDEAIRRFERAVGLFPELGAAYGVVQLRKLDRFNAQRRANWQRLEDLLATRRGVTTGRTTPEARTTWMRFCLAIDDDAPFTRQQVQEFLAERGVETRMVWTGNILRQPGFAKIEHRSPTGGLPSCDRIMDRALSLPIHHGLNDDHMTFICEQLDALYERYG